MTQWLLIGDVHAVPTELHDCQRLVDLVERTLADNPAARPVLLGDQHHTHGVVQLATVSFWRDALARWGGADRVIALVGNHDKPARDNPDRDRTVMDAYHDLCQVASPRLDIDGVTFVSHFPNPADFLRAADSPVCVGCVKAHQPGYMCAAHPRSLVVCHQTFSGALEGNFALPDGVDPDAVRYDRIISGHIHSPQRFGKVWYVGSPRWRTATDALVDQRAIWLVTTDGGRVVDEKPVWTSGVCRMIRLGTDTPDQPFDEAQLGDHSDWRVEVRGPAAYAHERRRVLVALGVKVRVVPTNVAPIRVRESEGVEASLWRYVSEYKAKRGTSPDRIAVRLRQLQEAA